MEKHRDIVSSQEDAHHPHLRNRKIWSFESASSAMKKMWPS